MSTALTLLPIAAHVQTPSDSASRDANLRLLGVGGAVGALAGGVVGRSLSQHFSDVVNVRDYGAKCDGTTDDTAAFQAALTAASARISSVEVNIPNASGCVISAGLTLNISGVEKTIALTAHGLHGARLLFPAGFIGTGISVLLTNTSGSQGKGESFYATGITFSHAGTDTSGTALAVHAINSDSVDPSVDLDNLVFNSITTGSWANGVTLLDMNVTDATNITCFGFAGTCMSYDSDGSISVEHHLRDIYLNGSASAIGISIGHPSMTGALQGFTIRGLSCTGGAYCIKAQSADAAIDEIVVEGSQFNAATAGIYANGADTVVAIGNYFLGGSRGMDIEDNSRIVVSGNTFMLGPDQVAGTHNVSVYTTNLGGGPAAGSIISGNLFTNLYGIPVQLGSNTNYVTVSGNTCLGNQCVSDTSGNTRNGVGPNLDSGALAFGTKPLFYSGLNVSPRGTGYPLSLTADGVGNALIKTTLPGGAGTTEIGPNVKLDGTTSAGTVNAGSMGATGSVTAGSAGMSTPGSVTANNLVVGPSGAPYPLSVTGDGVGSAAITTALTSGAGMLSLGPNVTAKGTFIEPGGAVPTSSASPCTKGQHAWDANYEYRCVSPGRWGRIPYQFGW